MSHDTRSPDQPTKLAHKAPTIIDIRGQHVKLDLTGDVVSMLNPDHGPRHLPTLLLYSEKGLQLFEDITHLDEYYLTNYEIDVLKKSCVDIAKRIPEGSMLIELGSGNLRKVCLLLQAFEDLEKYIDYYALDLSGEELERTLAELPQLQYVSCHGLLGTYDDGREWMKQSAIAGRSKYILHLGSSIGNFDRDEAANFLRGFADVLQPSDAMLIGVDSCNDPGKVYRAYNDSKGVTHQFILNGLKHANTVFGKEVFKVEDWKVIGEYVHDTNGGRHQAFVSPIRTTEVLGLTIHPHERIQIEQSYKYSGAELEHLWATSGLKEVQCWNRGNEYGLHLLQRSALPFDLGSSRYAAGPLPTVQDWEAVWTAWDTVTKRMLPDQELTEKPIKLRNACIFYLGHIPTFLDIQLTKTTGKPPTEPASYASIFERGIDPDVDNPEHCHAHSEVPNEWPPAEEITEYQDRVRSRLLSLYKNGAENIPRDVGRAIWIGFEHELMHMETLLYMLLQSDKTLPPSCTPAPDFGKLAQQALENRVPNEWFDVPEQTITIGMNDPESRNDSGCHFGWDNEKPSRQANVHGFQAQGRPITNEEFAEYMYHLGINKLPASWASSSPSENGAVNGHQNGTSNGHGSESKPVPESFLQDKFVRTVYGLVPLKLALDWPVFASYDELAGCASWMGGRIPTLEEARSIYEYVYLQKRAEAERKLGKTVPAVNGHLINDGVEETPPQSDLFRDLAGANVGFQHWHPVSVTAQGNRLAGQAEMGGVWEWTSSPLRRHEGFEPMALYPGYTADFFDDKHNVVLGGSWATHPRIAGRKSFVNWYQRNYPYAWVGARLVRDAE